MPSELELCKEGVLLLLSDRLEEAEEHFSQYYGSASILMLLN